MTRNEILAELIEILNDTFDGEGIDITESTMASDVEDWDSLAQINIIVACESKFKVKFEMKETIGIANVGELCSTIERKLGQTK